eukprot:76952-Prorocentrum_minimum.AAC.1
MAYFRLRKGGGGLMKWGALNGPELHKPLISRPLTTEEFSSPSKCSRTSKRRPVAPPFFCLRRAPSSGVRYRAHDTDMVRAREKELFQGRIEFFGGKRSY